MKSNGIRTVGALLLIALWTAGVGHALEVRIETNSRGLAVAQMSAPQLRWLGALHRFVNAPGIAPTTAAEQPLEFSLETAEAITRRLAESGWPPERLAALDPESARRDPVFQTAWEAAARQAGEKSEFEPDRIRKVYRQLQWMRAALPTAGLDAAIADHQRRSVDVLTQDYNMTPEQLRSVFPPLGNVTAAIAETAKAASGPAAPAIKPDGSRDENALKEWHAIGNKLSGMDRAEIEVMGQLYRGSLIKKWKPLDELDRARTPEEFARAVSGVARLAVDRDRLSRQADGSVFAGKFLDAHTQALASLGTAGAVRMAGLIAAEKGYISYHGKTAAAVEEFSRYLAGHRRNGAAFVAARKYEFRDHLQLVLMFAQALAISDRPETAEALATATAHWIKATNGILSFSRLPLRGPVELALRFLEPLFRQNPSVRRSVEEGMRGAEARPAPEGIRDGKSLGRGLFEMGLIVAVLLTAANLLLAPLALAGRLSQSLPPWLALLGYNAIVLLFAAIQFLTPSRSPARSTVRELRDSWDYRRARKQI